jgi:hypothetical protein
MENRFFLKNSEMAYVKKNHISGFSKLSPFGGISNDDLVCSAEKLNKELFDDSGAIKSQDLAKYLDTIAKSDRFMSIIMGSSGHGGVIPLFFNTKEDDKSGICCVMEESGFDISSKVNIRRVLDYIAAFSGETENDEIYFEMSCSSAICMTLALMIDFLRETIETGADIRFTNELFSEKYREYLKDAQTFSAILKKFLFVDKEIADFDDELEDFVKMGSLIREDDFYLFESNFLHELLRMSETDVRYFFLRVSKLSKADSFIEGTIGAAGSGEHFIVIEPHPRGDVVKVIIAGNLKVRNILCGAVVKPDLWLDQKGRGESE